MATKSASKTPALQFEKIHRQNLSLCMAARSYSQSNYPNAIKHCKTWDEKFYVRRENLRITNFLTSINLWLSLKPWDQSDKPGNGRNGPNSGHLSDLPFYHPERTDLDHLLPSEFIGIRIQAEKFNDHLVEQFGDQMNGVMNVAAVRDDPFGPAGKHRHGDFSQRGALI